MDDAVLVRQALAGQADAYAELISRWAGRVFALCHGQMGCVRLLSTLPPPVRPSEALWPTSPSAEARAREVLLRGFDDLVAFPDLPRFAPWLATLALAACREHHGTPLTPPALIQEGDLLASVDQLPAELRSIVAPFYYQPRPYRELGHFLDLSPSAVASRLLRARLLLKGQADSLASPFEPTRDLGDAPLMARGAEGDCGRYQALLSARLDHEIRDQEAQLLDIHLAECPACQGLARGWAEQHRALQAAFAPVKGAADAFATKVRAEFQARGPRKCSVLVVDDEPYLLPTLRALLSPYFEVFTANGVDVAKQIFSQRSIDIVLTDQRMPGQSGVQLLEWVRVNHPCTVRLLMTGYSELDDAVEAINRGHVYHYLLKPWRTEELLNVLRNAADKFELERKRDRYLSELQALNRELELRVAERTRELEEANLLLQQRTRELERLALTDPLTGLFNRRAIDELVRFELKRHARYPSPLTLGYVDVDHFKRINTEHLLTGGDEVLKSLARILTASLREVDSVARVGGEEFLVIARETGLEGAEVLGERIRSTVEETPIEYNGQKMHITVSLGFVVAEAGVPADQATLTQQAASALAHAKQTGRNRCEIRLLTPVTDQASA